MKMKNILTITLLCFFSLCAFNQGYTQECVEKIYVSPEQILLCPEGIFYLTEEGDFAPAQYVGFDESGLYVGAPFYYCPACNRVNRDDICQNRVCPLYGK